MNELAIFKNEEMGVEIRTLIGSNNEPLFCLKDLCTNLGLVASKVAQRLEKDVLSKHPLSTKGGIQNFHFVNEAGMYDVVLESRKPNAKQFRKWITSEVIPSIRKTGKYSLDSTAGVETAKTLNVLVNSLGILVENVTEYMHKTDKVLYNQEQLLTEQTKMKIEIAAIQSAMKYQRDHVDTTQHTDRLRAIEITACPSLKNYISITLNNLDVQYAKEGSTAIQCRFVTEPIPWSTRKKVREAMEKRLSDPKFYSIKVL